MLKIDEQSSSILQRYLLPIFSCEKTDSSSGVVEPLARRPGSHHCEEKLAESQGFEPWDPR